MIVGNGLIASTFKKSKYDYNDYIIFASGVSNSKLENKNDFNRELELIKKYIKTNKKFIYFSSIHLLDPSQNNSMYVQHKIEMEDFIKSNFDKYIIFRLPIIMGTGGNNKSLFNYLYDCIINQEKMNIYVESYRYVMDVEDVVKFVNNTLHVNKKILNLVFNEPYNILEIINAYEQVLNITAKYNKCDGGDFFEVDNSVLEKNMSNSEMLNMENTYIQNLIKKYYLNKNIHLLKNN